MDFMNIGISGFALKSNFQVGYKLLMDEVIGKASSMKSVRQYVQEYDTDLHLAIYILERRLVRNVDVAASTSTYELEVISEDGNDEEKIQKTSNSVELKEVMDIGHLTDSSGSTLPTISERVCKIFPGMGWFGGNIDGIRQDDNGNIYDILFEDGDTEEWLQDEYDNNTANACICIGNIIFRFIKKFYEV